MAEPLIFGALRTPVGAHGGGLASVRPDDLAATIVKSLVERTGVDPTRIDDVIFGCTNQAGEDNRNVARMALLLAGLPIECPGQTINRLCASGLQAITSASHAIRANEGSLFIAGGVESMTRAPYVQLKSPKAFDRTPPTVADTTVGWRFDNPKMPERWRVSLGETAEIVAERYGISREDQERFAVESQRRAKAAWDSGFFDDEIVPVEVPQRKGEPISMARDEHLRPEVTLEKLAKLRPAFRREGTVTAGTSSGINDGAAALLVGSSEHTSTWTGATPMARIVSTAVAGVDPSCMGLGPIPATRMALERAGIALDEIDLIELNEAFAAQALACIKELGLDPAKVNPYGGGIALGHPLGCTGARILVTLVHALSREKKRYGLATLCIGVGQGMAMIVERIS